MISVLVPTRGRPKEFRRMMESLQTTASGIELIAYWDIDDPYQDYPTPVHPWFFSLVGPRLTLSDYWNTLAKIAHGDILMLGADDMVFQTRNWDMLVEKAFYDVPDKILMVHGRDGSNGWADDGRFGVFPIIHRKWIDTVGYFTPPGYGGDYCDTWLNDVADMIGRRKYLPELMQEHLHFAWGKGPIDTTMREKLERDRVEKVDLKYKNDLPLRERDAEKLRAVML